MLAKTLEPKLMQNTFKGGLISDGIFILVPFSTTKLLSVEAKNSQVILRIVLLILTKFLQKSQIRRALLQEFKLEKNIEI